MRFSRRDELSESEMLSRRRRGRSSLEPDESRDEEDVSRVLASLEEEAEVVVLSLRAVAEVVVVSVVLRRRRRRRRRRGRFSSELVPALTDASFFEVVFFGAMFFRLSAVMMRWRDLARGAS